MGLRQFMVRLFASPREYVQEWSEEIRDRAADARIEEMERHVQQIETDREVRQRYLETLRDSLKND